MPYFYIFILHLCFFDYVILLRPLLLRRFNGFLTLELGKPSASHTEPTHYNLTSVMRGHKHSFAFSFANFLEFQLKSVMNIDRIWLQTQSV